MVRINILFLLLVLLVNSCTRKEDEEVIYEVVYFRDSSIRMQTDTVLVSSKHSIENGKYTLSDDHDRVISEGVFNEGFRDGRWIYNPSDTTAIEILWLKYTNDSSKVAINYPNRWRILEDPQRPFQASFPLSNDEAKAGKYFIILSYNKDSINLDLDGYQRYYKSQMFSTEKVKEYAHFVFETASRKRFYFMRYIVKRDDEELSIFSFIGDKGSQIYDITYSSSSKDEVRKHIIFFDMIRSLQLEGKWFFSPYDPVKQFDRLEYKDNPQATT